MPNRDGGSCWGRTSVRGLKIINTIVDECQAEDVIIVSSHQLRILPVDQQDIK